MFQTRENMTDFTRASHQPFTVACRSARGRSAHRCDRADGLSLFDLTSSASPAPHATADSTVRSQWATRDAGARLAVRCHLPTTERAHFSQYKSAQTLYDAVVARYSSPATAALSRLMLPYLFPDLLKARLLAAETSIVAVGASRDDPRTPVFEGCSPSPLLPSVASAAAADLAGFESVGAASAPSGRRRTGKGKGGKGTGGASWGGGGGGAWGCWVYSCGLSRYFVEVGVTLSAGATRVVCPVWSRAAGDGGTTVAASSEGTRTGNNGTAGAGGAAEAAGVGLAGGPAGTGAAGPAGTGAAGPAGTGAAGATGAGAAGGVGAGGSAGAGPSEGAGLGAVGAWGAASAGAAAGGTGAVPAESGGAPRPRPYFVPLLEQVLGLPPSTGSAPPLACPQPVPSQSQLQLGSPLPAPSPYTGPTGGLTERLSSLPVLADPESYSFRAASPTVTRLLATVVTDPSFESTAASTLVAELVDFAARCRLDYAASLVAESASVCPPSVAGECALSTDVLEDRQEEFQCFAAALPHLVSTLTAPEGDPDAPDIPTPQSYAEAVEGPYSSQWVKRPPGSPPVFKARYVARGFSQRQEVDFFQTFSPTPKMTTLRVLLHVAAQRDYELHSLDFSTAFFQDSRHEEIWLRRPPGFTGTTLVSLGFAPSTADPSLFLRTDTSLPPFYILVAQRTITLNQSHMVQQVLQRFDFTYSSPQATPLSTRHLLSALPSDESVEPSGPYPEVVGCLMYLITCTRPDLAYPLSILACYAAPGRHRPEHMAAAKRVLRYLCSTSGLGLVLGGRSPVVLTGHADASWVDDLATQRSSQGYTFSLGSGSVSWRAMAAQELRWLTYLLTDLGEPPRFLPVLYVDNKAMLALCREHRLEHRTKHIALHYFLARELQQRGQLRLAYLAS
ncbi:unnamed protein product [Closterium sp. NIES-53]